MRSGHSPPPLASGRAVGCGRRGGGSSCPGGLRLAGHPGAAGSPEARPRRVGRVGAGRANSGSAGGAEGSGRAGGLAAEERAGRGLASAGGRPPEGEEAVLPLPQVRCRAHRRQGHG